MEALHLFVVLLLPKEMSHVIGRGGMDSGNVEGRNFDDICTKLSKKSLVTKKTVGCKGNFCEDLSIQILIYKRYKHLYRLGSCPIAKRNKFTII